MLLLSLHDDDYYCISLLLRSVFLAVYVSHTDCCYTGRCIAFALCHNCYTAQIMPAVEFASVFVPVAVVTALMPARYCVSLEMQSKYLFYYKIRIMVLHWKARKQSEPGHLRQAMLFTRWQHQSVCLCVSKITQKVMKGSVWNYFYLFLLEKSLVLSRLSHRQGSSQYISSSIFRRK